MLWSHDFCTGVFRDFSSLIFRKTSTKFAHILSEAFKSIQVRPENSFKFTAFQFGQSCYQFCQRLVSIYCHITSYLIKHALILIKQAGSRIFFGKEFVYIQMRIFSVVLLSYFVFKLSDGKKTINYKKMINLHIDGGLHVSVFRRQATRMSLN